MPQRHLAAVLVFAAAGLLTVGAKADPAAKADHGKPPADASESPADKAFLGAMRDMVTGLHANAPTGDTDSDFVHLMLPQHQAALDMAKAELRYGKDDGLKAMAKEIVTTQEKEIALMKAWEDKKKVSH